MNGKVLVVIDVNLLFVFYRQGNFLFSLVAPTLDCQGRKRTPPDMTFVKMLVESPPPNRPEHEKEYKVVPF